MKDGKINHSINSSFLKSSIKFSVFICLALFSISFINAQTERFIAVNYAVFVDDKLDSLFKIIDADTIQDNKKLEIFVFNKFNGVWNVRKAEVINDSAKISSVGKPTRVITKIKQLPKSLLFFSYKYFYQPEPGTTGESPYVMIFKKEKKTVSIYSFSGDVLRFLSVNKKNPFGIDKNIFRALYFI